MRRIRNKTRYRRHARRRGETERYRRAIRRAFERARNEIRSSLRDGGVQRVRAPRRAPTFDIIPAPRILNVVQNPDEVAQFIEQIKLRFDRRRPVFIDLTEVEEIEYDGITMLLAILVRFHAKRVQINGNFPNDERVLRVLEESQFFEHLFHGKFKDRNSYVIPGSSTIVTHGKKKVDPDLGSLLIRHAAETVWGEPRRCTRVQRALVELMHNTNNHATAPRGESRHWWLSIKHYPKTRRAAFSFFDFGVGIFTSLRTVNSTNPLFGAIDRLRERVAHGTDAEILGLILAGELRRSATGHPYRGNGLPGIFRDFQANHFSSLVIMTNSVYYNAGTGEIRTLAHPFTGTFVYWELNQTNHSLPNATPHRD
jgi:hypothetical protein